MSLAVSVHQRDPESGKLGPDLVVGPGASLAGFEVWRASVYGSDSVRRRGARFLPQLASGDLLVEGETLAPFKAECAGLVADAEQLSAELGIDAETLKNRFSNLAAAADQATLVAGVVWIS